MNLSKRSGDKELFSGTLIKENTLFSGILIKENILFSGILIKENTLFYRERSSKVNTYKVNFLIILICLISFVLKI